MIADNNGKESMTYAHGINELVAAIRRALWTEFRGEKEILSRVGRAFEERSRAISTCRAGGCTR
jgi:hypothetical protein